jgi:hypothetical protein
MSWADHAPRLHNLGHRNQCFNFVIAHMIHPVKLTYRKLTQSERIQALPPLSEASIDKRHILRSKVELYDHWPKPRQWKTR